MIEVLCTAHWRVRWDVGRRLVVLARSPVPFHAAAQIDAAMTPVHAALDPFPRPSTAILADLRDGAASNDPMFERVFAPHRRRMLDGFARVAVLVRTATGKLQVHRHLHEDRIAAGVFTREDEALVYLGRTSMMHPTA